MRLTPELIDQHREQIAAWATACGLDPARIPEGSTFEIANGSVSVDIFASRPARLGPDGQVLLTRVTVPLAAPFPDLSRANTPKT